MTHRSMGPLLGFAAVVCGCNVDSVIATPWDAGAGGEGSGTVASPVGSAGAEIWPNEPPSCRGGLECNGESCCTSLLVPGGSNTGFQAAAEGVPKFEWDESLAVRPEHFADMVYQVCSLTRGACVSEFHLYGLAQDISGF